MGITKRRKQFLEEVIKIYQDTLLPVHYETIAEAVGVSKWTAYDVMKVLEKEGYLKRIYKKNQNDTGRSIVLFIPTEEVIKLTSDNTKQISNPKKEKEIKDELINIKKISHNQFFSESVSDLFKKMDDFESKVEFCYYFLGILVIYLNQLGKEHRDLTKFVMTVSGKTHVQLSVFVGLVVGMITFKENDTIALNISENSYQFFEFLEELTSDELNKLVDFLNEI
ncbi:MAG TPA: Lrp/AsnC family transcriptional regulator [Metabacillus sp.]|nr:Lrp/AsnC family transcriptional regulator [Metabacillus sp.]